MRNFLPSAGNWHWSLVFFVLVGVLHSVRVKAAPFNCVGGSVYTVAHADDDLLFQSPDLLHEIQAGLCITTVIFTAGDAGEGLDYAESREAGNIAAYAEMIGVNSSYTETHATFGGQSVLVRTFTSAPKVSKVFFRLPDGNTPDWEGYAVTGWESLRRLYFGLDPTIKAIDGTATYTLSTLRQALSDILAARVPDNVRTLDYLSNYDAGDHSDHLTVARLTTEVAGAYSVTGYMGYPIENFAATMATTSTDYKQKMNAFFAYTPYDQYECQSISACAGRGEYYWLRRQYAVTPSLATTSNDGSAESPVTLPSGINIALQATATASSGASGQEAAQAIDYILGGYPGNATTEWASNGQTTGAWIKLTWTTTVTVQNVVIYDRPNMNDWLQGGYLTFDDGSTVTFTNPINDGTAYIIPLSQSYTTKTLTLTVTSVSSTTVNVGLSEIQVYGVIGATSTTSSAPSSTPTSSGDLALTGTASASSWSASTSQTPDKAIDGVIGGYPGDYTVEWASDGQGAGAWWALSWSSSVTINRVVLYDRPNTNDWITAGTITFSDGSTLAITSLDNAGGAITFDFAAKTITSLNFTITAVSSTTENVGLSEFQAYYISTGASSSASVTTATGTATSTTSTAPSASATVSISSDLALNGTATASSSGTVTSQTPDKAIDGVIGGYPGAYTVEWASNAEGVGAWWQVTWATSVTINRIVLYDRPNLNDQITAGTLTFSDGSTVTVTTLDNAGGATTFNFATKTVTSVRLTVTGVSSTTENVGLSEFQAYYVSTS